MDFSILLSGKWKEYSQEEFFQNHSFFFDQNVTKTKVQNEYLRRKEKQKQSEKKCSFL